MRRRHWYFLHRWLGGIVGIQLFLWALGGFIFATHDLDWVRGERGRSTSAPVVIDAAAVSVPVATAVAAAGVSGELTSVRLTPFLDTVVWEVRASGGDALVDAMSGERLSPLDREAAVAVALRDRAGSPAIVAADLLTAADEIPTEYREKPLPAWRVTLDDGEGTHIYVDARLGGVTARRNDPWRRFDFFWMLHTMDYGGRDDFNHPLLITFASLGLVTVASGWLLWGLRLRKRRVAAPPADPEKA